MAGDAITDLFITVANITSYFGICLMIFFMGLVLFSKHNRTIEGYFSAVASNSIFDLLYTVFTAIAKMDSFHKDGFFVFAINRFDYELDPFLTKIIVIGYLFTGHMCFYVVSIPFYIRYSLICKGQRVPYTIRALLYLFLIAYNTANISLVYTTLQTSPRGLVELQMKPYLKGNEKGRFWNFSAALLVSLEIILIKKISLKCFLNA